jgi:hypothetical protein
MSKDLAKMDMPTLEKLSVEEMLTGLTAFGAPRVSLVKNSWYAAIDMHVSSVGAEFKVGSSFDHNTPGSALLELVARVRKTLKDLNS